MQQRFRICVQPLLSLHAQFRFNTGGSSGSSSASSTRHVAMTQAKTLANVASGVSTFTGAKPMQTLIIKPNEEEEQKRKELELRRLKEKEEEAARKREEMMRAKAEEQKRLALSSDLLVILNQQIKLSSLGHGCYRKHEARAKRAMEQRALRDKLVGEEQKQKMESKEEKSAHLKMKLQVENQEKSERYI